eukprot:TRINITY_DN65998_c0_g1_i1.p1 TRINITY_DN65998_c0_g1~~TRINITY_DN65998_c0_g1_i1.p1  ORF type:complete len:182 (+),score=56.71 TRINITY_DN65998_c0_g1_i1:99-644(+)
MPHHVISRRARTAPPARGSRYQEEGAPQGTQFRRETGAQMTRLQFLFVMCMMPLVPMATVCFIARHWPGFELPTPWGWTPAHLIKEAAMQSLVAEGGNRPQAAAAWQAIEEYAVPPLVFGCVVSIMTVRCKQVGTLKSAIYLLLFACVVCTPIALYGMSKAPSPFECVATQTIGKHATATH